MHLEVLCGSRDLHYSLFDQYSLAIKGYARGLSTALMFLSCLDTRKEPKKIKASDFFGIRLPRSVPRVYCHFLCLDTKKVTKERSRLKIISGLIFSYLPSAIQLVVPPYDGAPQTVLLTQGLSSKQENIRFIRKFSKAGPFTNQSSLATNGYARWKSTEGAKFGIFRCGELCVAGAGK